MFHCCPENPTARVLRNVPLVAASLICLAGLIASTTAAAQADVLNPWKAEFGRPPVERSSSARAARERPVSGVVDVTTKRSLNAVSARELAEDAGGQVVRRIPQIRAIEMRFAPQRTARALSILKRSPLVADARPAQLLSADHAACTNNPGCLVPNDALFHKQWYLQNDSATNLFAAGTPIKPGADIDAPTAWPTTRGSATVTVGILDTGLDFTHPEFAGKAISSAYLASNADAVDRVGHGTFITGIIGARWGNGAGIAGIAPDAKLFVIKASYDGSADPTSISTIAMANGIVYAADHGVNVLNISAGSPGYSTVLHNALAYAYAHNMLVIAAAGNEGNSVPNYPAADPNAIAVGATDQTDTRASFSSYGSSWVSIAAPGENIVSTAPTYVSALFDDTGYTISNGTSYAAPMVAAAAALLWPLTTDTNANGKTADDVAVRLVGYSEAVAGTGSEWLAGRLDICLAIHKAWAPCSPAAPAVTPPVADPQPAAPVKPAVPSTPVTKPKTTPKADPDALSKTAAVSAAKKYVTRRMKLKKYKLTCARDNASGFICRVTWKKGKRSRRQSIHVWRDGKTYVERW